MSASNIIKEAALENTYWGKKIILAEESGTKFSRDDINEAANWDSCAVGTLAIKIERTNFSSAPTDRELYDLGYTFAAYVNEQNLLFAARTLVDIYNRAKIVTVLRYVRNVR